MMPSSAAHTRLQQDTPPISFFAKVKSYLFAPFSWLMGTNEERDDAGQRLPATPSEPIQEEVPFRQTERARVRYQADQVSPSSASTRTRSFVSTSALSFGTQPSVSTGTQPSVSTHARPFASASVQPPVSNRAQLSVSTSAQPSTSTRAQPSASTRTQLPASTSAQPSALTRAQPSMSARTQPPTSTSARSSVSTSAQSSMSTSAQPSVPTSAYERDGLRKRKRTAAVSTEIKEQEGEGEDGEEEIQYLRRKSPEFKRRKYEPGSNGLRSIYEGVGKLPRSVPGPESLAIHKPTDRYSVRPVLPPVGIVRTFDRSETVSESQSSSGSSENTVTSVTPATLTRPSPFAKPGLYSECIAPPKNPDRTDMISMEFSQNHPAFVEPPPDRHGDPEWETIGEDPTIDEFLASEEEKEEKEWLEFLQKLQREHDERQEFLLQQKKIADAQAKDEDAKREKSKLEYSRFSNQSERGCITPRMCFFQKVYQAEFKRLMDKSAERRAQRVNRTSASNLVPTDVTVEVTEAQPSTSMTNEVDVEAARVQPSASVLQSVAVQTMEDQPSASVLQSVAIQTMEDQPLASVTNVVEVEAARVQPSTSVTNDLISEVANTRIPMSNNAIVEATNAQPSLPSPKDVSVESGQHYSPMSVDVSLESGRHYSPMSVDVSMESAENVLPSPSIPSTSGASSLRVGHAKSSRNRIPQPYTIRSRARSPAEGDGLMPDRDKEMAMLEEAAKNVPDFNLPANFSFTKNTRPTQGNTTFVSNLAPSHAASSISSPGIPFSYGTPGANSNVKGHVNPFVPSLPVEDPANPLWDGEKKTENAQRDLSLGQQAYAPAGSMSYGVNDPSSSHAGASELTLPNDSDQDCQMDVSPPNNRSASSGIGSQPFGQSFGQTSQGAGSFHPSTPGPFEQHSGGPGFSNSFTAPGFFASGSSSNQPNLVPFSGPNSFPSGVPFEANANQFNSNPNQSNQFNANQSGPTESNPNQFNQSNPNSFNQVNTTSFNQFNPNQYNPNQFNQFNPNQPHPTEFNSNQFNQSNPNSFNQFNATSFNQPNPNQFNQPNPNQFNQSTPSQFNQSTPNQFNQSTPNQFNPSALSSPSASLASTPVLFTIGAPPPVKLDRYGRPVKNKSSRPTKKLPQRNRMKQ